MTTTKKRIDDLERTLAAMQAADLEAPMSLWGRLNPEDGTPRCRIWQQPGALTRYKAHAIAGSFGFFTVSCPMIAQGPPLPGSGQERAERPCTTCPHWR